MWNDDGRTVSVAALIHEYEEKGCSRRNLEANYPELVDTYDFWANQP